MYIYIYQYWHDLRSFDLKIIILNHRVTVIFDVNSFQYPSMILI